MLVDHLKEAPVSLIFNFLRQLLNFLDLLNKYNKVHNGLSMNNIGIGKQTENGAPQLIFLNNFNMFSLLNKKEYEQLPFL